MWTSKNVLLDLNLNFELQLRNYDYLFFLHTAHILHLHTTHTHTQPHTHTHTHIILRNLMFFVVLFCLHYSSMYVLCLVLAWEWGSQAAAGRESSPSTGKTWGGSSLVPTAPWVLGSNLLCLTLILGRYRIIVHSRGGDLSLRQKLLILIYFKINLKGTGI